jgi:glycosyltransferase involved in cell wall biosynthesis
VRQNDSHHTPDAKGFLGIMSSAVDRLQTIVPQETGKAPGSARLKVGFIVHVMQVAGAEVLVAETIRHLREIVDPVVFCLDAIGPLGEKLRSEEVPVLCLQRQPGRDWRLPKRLAKLIDESGIQVVHAHQYTPFFYAALAKCVGRRRFGLILTEHGRHFPDLVSRARRWGNRLFLSRCANQVNAVCQFSAQALRERDGFCRQPVEVIENGIAWERYQTQPDKMRLRSQLGLDPQRRYVLCVARFHPVKDHATLLRAFALVAKQQENVDLLLAGDGSLRGELEALRDQLHLSARVRFLGVRSDVSDLLQAADIFTLASVSEAASLTLLEAMAAGLPVVVTEVGGNPEIVRQEQEGLLVPRQNPASLADALLRVLCNPGQAEAWGAAGRLRVQSQYSLSRTIQRYRELYQRVAAAYPPV